jgi:hypothetical protein
MPRTNSSLTLDRAPVAGDEFDSGIEYSLVGVSLANPTGAWPASGTSTQLTWVDHDGDGQPGLTSVIPTSGRSTTCNLPYGGLPIPATNALATRVYTGSRALASLDGTLVDCDTIAGEYTGPAAGGTPQLQGHVIGCLKENGAACTAAETQSLDEGAADAQRITGARFTMIRVPDDTTCAQARALDFP